MFIMLLIYLVALGLCSWFGPKVIAVIDKSNAKAEIGNSHALAGLIIGVLPVFNILFVFFGGWFFSTVIRVLQEDAKGNPTALSDFNAILKDLKNSSE